jgi:hypothetical protein
VTQKVARRCPKPIQTYQQATGKNGPADWMSGIALSGKRHSKFKALPTAQSVQAKLLSRFNG